MKNIKERLKRLNIVHGHAEPRNFTVTIDMKRKNPVPKVYVLDFDTAKIAK